MWGNLTKNEEDMKRKRKDVLNEMNGELKGTCGQPDPSGERRELKWAKSKRRNNDWGIIVFAPDRG